MRGGPNSGGQFQIWQLTATQHNAVAHYTPSPTPAPFPGRGTYPSASGVESGLARFPSNRKRTEAVSTPFLLQ